MTRGPRPFPLPRPLADTPFTVQTARENGVSGNRMRRHDLERGVYGVRSTTLSVSVFRERCELFATRLDSAVFFSHGTAALLLGIPVPPWIERELDLHVSVMSPRRAPHADGLIGHSRMIIEGDVTTTGDLRHSTAPRAWCELSWRLTLPELVAAGDAIVNVRNPMSTISDLAERVAGNDPIARCRKLREAMPLLDGRSESPPESKLRVILALAGLPHPVVNHVVVPSGFGGIRTDLAYPDVKFAIEYQGDYHRSREQWRADMTRRSRLEALGWYILEVNADDLRKPDELVARIRAILARR